MARPKHQVTPPPCAPERGIKAATFRLLLDTAMSIIQTDGHIPSVAEIRSKFTERRKGAGAIDKMLRRLLGLEAKMRQYRDGAAFVRGVQERVGVDGFNAIWTSPQTLPKPLEITDPAAWVTRVHG
jgi:putative hydrolase